MAATFGWRYEALQFTSMPFHVQSSSDYAATVPRPRTSVMPAYRRVKASEESDCAVAGLRSLTGLLVSILVHLLVGIAGVMSAWRWVEVRHRL